MSQNEPTRCSLTSESKYHSHRTDSLYGAFAFGSIILTCFAGYFFNQRFYRSEWMVPLTFGMGALYAILGVLSGRFVDGHGRITLGAYYLLQCSLLTAMVHLSPIRGFFGIIVLPMISQAIFDLRTRNALGVGLYLFALSISVWAIPFGWDAAWEAAINYSAAFAFTVAFTIITKQALDARDHSQQLTGELEKANEQLHAHAAEVEDLATTRERNRLAREIHDGIGHYLTVVKTQLDAATELLPGQPARAREAVVKAARLSAEALDDVRRSVGALRTDTARTPLPEAVRELASHGEPASTFTIEGTPRPLAPAIEHALFRAAQEGLTNIRKHARATSALVVLDFRAARCVRLEMSDNGVGAQPSANDNGAGFGLIGLRERIALLGGSVDAANRLEGGFALRVELPT